MTADTSKSPLISAAILARMVNGETLPEAVDAVLGLGTYAKMVGDLYAALRTKAK